QYSGTAGRIENCQVGVFLAFAGRRGHAFLDRELYLPKEWAADPDRREEAGIPAGGGGATKPHLAARVAPRARAGGGGGGPVAAAGVTADAVYGNDSKFRRFLEETGQPYVLAVQSGQRLWVGFEQVRVDELAAELPPGAWRRASAGAGAKGPRWYDWAVVRFG